MTKKDLRKNWEMRAIQSYLPVSQDYILFTEDYTYLTRLASRLKCFSRHGKINIRLLMNYYIISCNVFDRKFVQEYLFQNLTCCADVIYSFISSIDTIIADVDVDPTNHNKQIQLMILKELK